MKPINFFFWTLVIGGLSSCTAIQANDPFSGKYLISEDSNEKLVPAATISRIGGNQWEVDWQLPQLQGLGKKWTIVPIQVLADMLDKSVDVSKIICISDTIDYPSPMVCKVPKDRPLKFPITGPHDFPMPTGYAIVGGTPAGILAFPILKVK